MVYAINGCRHAQVAQLMLYARRLVDVEDKRIAAPKKRLSASELRVVKDSAETQTRSQSKHPRMLGGASSSRSTPYPNPNPD